MLQSFAARPGCSKHRNCRQNLLQGRSCLEIAGRACPGAAAGSKWPLELAPEPQNARKVLLKPGPEPQNAREVVLEPAPEPQNAPKMRLEPAPDPQNARRVSLELAPEPQQARKVLLEPTAVRCVRFLRSTWPLEKCCLLFVCYRHQLLLGSILLRACYARVHTSIYIYIYYGFTLTHDLL